MVKFVKKLPEMMSQLDFELVLIEIDRFLYLYSTEAQSDVLDLPNRIVKTIVHSIVKYKGAETKRILTKIAPITGDDDSTLVHLVNILLQQQDAANHPPDTGSASSDSMGKLRDLRERVKAQSKALQVQQAVSTVGHRGSYDLGSFDFDSQDSLTRPPSQSTLSSLTSPGLDSAASISQLRDKIKTAVGVSSPGNGARGLAQSTSISELRHRLDRLKSSARGGAGGD
eukprot:c14891_g1_i1.p1 GENE.c14891_g1_i1~~c14891_g1_i1.p1  ORF type:complete len:236 (-),score=67.60 c14891_g1_i1:161-841(-)